MKLVIVSNYYNHHQRPLCRELFKALEGDFCFVVTGALSPERAALGYTEMTDPFVLDARTPEGREEALSLCRESECVITGSAPEEFIANRLRKNLLTLRYSERIFKTGRPALRTVASLLKNHTRWRNKRLYMLCASAYTPADLAPLGAYPGKFFRWGYFPETPPYAGPFGNKNKVPVLLWAGRFLDWKHPEQALRTARYLKEAGIPFHLRMVGTGPLEEELRHMRVNWNLQAQVTFTGSMPPEQVRAEMAAADIFLFTSSFTEGWGAVLNEAMNAGCAVAASHAAGSVPYLLAHGHNGLVYNFFKPESLYHAVARLCADAPLRQRLSVAAYETIQQVWNAGNAAKQLLALLQALGTEPYLQNAFSRLEKRPPYPAAGPGSVAPVIWQKNMLQYVCGEGG